MEEMDDILHGEGKQHEEVDEEALRAEQEEAARLAAEEAARVAAEAGKAPMGEEGKAPSPGEAEAVDVEALRREIAESKAAAEAAAQREAAKQAEIDRIRAKNREMAAALEGKEVPQGEEKTFWDNPDEALAQARQAAREEFIAERINLSEMIARDKYADFDEKLAVFAELAQTSPALIHDMRNNLNPAKFAYETAKKHQALKEIGEDPETFKAKTRAELEKDIRAQIAAEAAEAERLKAEAEKQTVEDAIAAKLPGAMSEVRGVREKTETTRFSPNTPMSAILSGKKK